MLENIFYSNDSPAAKTSSEKTRLSPPLHVRGNIEMVLVDGDGAPLEANKRDCCYRQNSWALMLPLILLALFWLEQRGISIGLLRLSSDVDLRSGHCRFIFYRSLAENGCYSYCKNGRFYRRELWLLLKFDVFLRSRPQSDEGFESCRDHLHTRARTHPHTYMNTLSLSLSISLSLSLSLSLFFHTHIHTHTHTHTTATTKAKASSSRVAKSIKN
jgi:hypothetical protein